MYRYDALSKREQKKIDTEAEKQAVKDRVKAELKTAKKEKKG